MKKNLFFLSLALVLLLLACDYQIPSAVQIKGSPDLRFSAKFDMGEYLKDFFDEDSFKQNAADIVLMDCKNTSVVTYLVYMELFNGTLDLLNNGINTGFDYTVPSAIELAKDDFEVPALDFGDILDNFQFSSIESKFYISGSPIVDVLSVEINGSSFENKNERKASSLGGKTVYDKTALPEGGTEIDLSFTGDKITINYNIYVEKDKVIKSEWMNDTSVLIELALWLPFEFTAKHDGAELGLPDDLFSDGDLFGRSSTDSDNTVTDMLESFNFSIKMNTNPFKKASLVLESKGISLINPLKGASMEFGLDEKNMKAINSPENFPFVPQLKLVFDQGGALSFPQNFTITEIAFKAKLNYTMDF